MQLYLLGQPLRLHVDGLLVPKRGRDYYCSRRLPIQVQAAMAAAYSTDNQARCHCRRYVDSKCFNDDYNRTSTPGDDRRGHRALLHDTIGLKMCALRRVYTTCFAPVQD